jgi:hypothetical protein
MAASSAISVALALLFRCRYFHGAQHLHEPGRGWRQACSPMLAKASSKPPNEWKL